MQLTRPSHKLVTFSMNKPRASTRDKEVDRVRTIFWYHILADEIGTPIAARIQRTLLDVKRTPGLWKSSRFVTYSKGMHVPQQSMVTLAESFCEASSYVINHVIWQVFVENIEIPENARAYIGKLDDPEVQNCVLNSANKRKIQERETTGKMLLRRFGLDALAVLLILFKLNRGNYLTNPNSKISLLENIDLIKLNIFRILILMGEKIPVEARKIVFDLFRKRVFSVNLDRKNTEWICPNFDYNAAVIQFQSEAKQLGIAIASPLGRDDLRRLSMEISPDLWHAESTHRFCQPVAGTVCAEEGSHLQLA